MPDLLSEAPSIAVRDLPDSSDRPLSLNDWLFVEACCASIKRHGHIDRVESYKTLHPDVTYKSANTLAWRLLKKVEVVAAIETRLKAEGLTKETILSVMWEAIEQARIHNERDTVLNGCMNLLKARGEIVDKNQTVPTPTADLSSEELWAELQRRTMADPKTSDNVDSAKVPPASPKSDSVPAGLRQNAPQ